MGGSLKVCVQMYRLFFNDGALIPLFPPSPPSTDRSLASEHLPLAWTRSSQEDEELLMTKLQEMAERFRETEGARTDDQQESGSEGGTD